MSMPLAQSMRVTKGKAFNSLPLVRSLTKKKPLRSALPPALTSWPVFGSLYSKETNSLTPS